MFAIKELANTDVQHDLIIQYTDPSVTVYSIGSQLLIVMTVMYVWSGYFVKICTIRIRIQNYWTPTIPQWLHIQMSQNFLI